MNTKTNRIKTMAALITLVILGVDTFAFATDAKVMYISEGQIPLKNDNGQQAMQNEAAESKPESAEIEGLSVLDDGFTVSNLPEEVKTRMQGRSYPDAASISMSELRYLRVLYIGFDGGTHQGELVVNRLVAEEVLEIFRILYEQKYPIAKMVLIDDYNADDNASMADNNTSAFCWRDIQGGGSLSHHAVGLAIDINPLLNPYIKEEANGSRTVLPVGAESYLERDESMPGVIIKGDDCYNAFISRGWLWGGDFVNMKDYQHFYKVIQ